MELRSNLLSLVALGAAILPAQAAAPYQHVLLISVDGLHALDLQNYIHNNSGSAMAQLAATGVTYSNASTAKPSDSFPGLIGEITGGLPQTTGIWYDVTYNRLLSAPGSSCATVGAQVAYDESIDYDSTQLDGGASQHNGHAINPAALPLDPGNGCKPIYPSGYLKVNTLFEVIHAGGLRTAWTDKHPAYKIVAGPSASGLDDFYGPEIASDVPADVCNGTGSWTGSICAVTNYDGLKVKATLNQISGFDHTGAMQVGTPAVFGMNFQAVSVGQKLASDYQYGACGYTDALGTPTACLSAALDSVDHALGLFINDLKEQGLFGSTLIVLTAKHGQSPIDPSKVTHIDPSLIPATVGSDYAFDISDDGSLIWLTDQSQYKSVVATLSTPANQALLGIQEIFAGPSLALLFDDPATDPRTPDIILKTNTGVIYSTGSKIAEHGGFNDDDVHVALVVSNPGLAKRTQTGPVHTKQIAPTIVNALGLNPSDLQAVQAEATPVLPNLF